MDDGEIPPVPASPDSSVAQSRFLVFGADPYSIGWLERRQILAAYQPSSDSAWESGESIVSNSQDIGNSL